MDLAALEKDIEIELAKYLLEKVENGKYPSTYTYKEAALELEKRLGRPVNAHFGLRHPLGKVLELCFDLRLPLLSALLYKNTGGKRQGAGEGFYTLAREYKPQYRDMTPFDAWKQELALIRACKDWTPLRNYLDKF